MFAVLSTIAQTIPASPIRKLVPFAMEAKGRGIQVLHLNIGDPDIASPVEMLDVLRSWDRSTVGYANSHGEETFLQSLLSYYHELGNTFLKTEDLQVTFGGSEGLLWTFLTICDVDDEILTFEPFYTNYASLAVMARARLVTVATTLDTGFHLPKVGEIEAKITPRTKAILVCNPSNPTGTVYTKEEIELLVELAKKHNLFLIADEVYREFVYDGVKAVSLLDYAQDMSGQIIVVDSLSKRYSMCGARLGCLVSLNTDFMSACLRYAQARLSAGLVDQLMAAALAKIPDSYFSEITTEYTTRRNLLVSGLQKIPGVTCNKPEGAFYIIAELPVDDAEEFAKWLLTDFSHDGKTVMVAPAAGFYEHSELGKKQVRIAYVLNTEKLKNAIDLLQIALEQYKKS